MQAITDGFAERGVEPGRTICSAFAHLRTNDAALLSEVGREQREFALAVDGRSLQPAPLERSPDTSFSGDGRQTTSFGTDSFERARAVGVAAQPERIAAPLR